MVGKDLLTLDLETPAMPTETLLDLTVVMAYVIERSLHGHLF